MQWWDQESQGAEGKKKELDKKEELSSMDTEKAEVVSEFSASDFTSSQASHIF